jgi:hypothetical protein
MKMNANAMVQALGAMSALAGPAPEIVFCDECPELAFGRVDGAPLCLSCMLARLERAEPRQGDPC